MKIKIGDQKIKLCTYGCGCKYYHNQTDRCGSYPNRLSTEYVSLRKIEECPRVQNLLTNLKYDVY